MTGEREREEQQMTPAADRPSRRADCRYVLGHVGDGDGMTCANVSFRMCGRVRGGRLDLVVPMTGAAVQYEPR